MCLPRLVASHTQAALAREVALGEAAPFGPEPQVPGASGGTESRASLKPRGPQERPCLPLGLTFPARARRDTCTCVMFPLSNRSLASNRSTGFMP